MNFRSLRVGKLIREELGMLIEREMEFPGALATITDVIVSPKLETAAVKISAIPTEKAPEVLKALELAAGKLQHLLNKKMNIKPMPRIYFEIDRGQENAAAVEKLLIDDNNK